MQVVNYVSLSDKRVWQEIIGFKGRVGTFVDDRLIGKGVAGSYRIYHYIAN